MTYKGPEYYAQKTIIDWLKWNTDLKYYHFAQEGKRSPQYMHFLKEIGFQIGVSDLFFPKSNDHYKGLWLELKTGKNKPTVKQLQFIDDMAAEGYQAVIIWEAWPAIDYINEFYALNKPLDPAPKYSPKN